MPWLLLTLFLFGPAAFSAFASQADSALEERIHHLVNEERKGRGIPALEWDEDLSSAARDHSRRMAEARFFSHDDPEGNGPAERIGRAGLIRGRDFGVLAENLFQAARIASVHTLIRDDEKRTETVFRSDEELARRVVEGWLKSPGHRKNLLDPRLRREGIGVFATDARLYVTQDFIDGEP